MQNPRLRFAKVGIDELSAIRPMWEKLRAHHAAISPHFSERRRALAFESRADDFRQKAATGRLRVDVVYTADNGPPVAYCVTSLSAELIGEIDSLFVEEGHRRSGVGSELMRRAVSWLDAHGAKTKTISVVDGNEGAIAFYQRFGFLPDNITLRHRS